MQIKFDKYATQKYKSFYRIMKMANRLVVYITSLTMVVFVLGCPSAKPESVEPLETLKLKSESGEVKLNTFESGDVTVSNILSNQTEPDRIESIEFEVNNSESIVVEANEPERLKIEAGEAKTAGTEPIKLQKAGVDRDKLENNSAASFHDKCAETLKDFVNEQGMVDYTTLRRQRLRLKALLGEFDDLDPNKYRSWSREDKIAFWLNAYNIQMLKIITDNYPIQSSRILRLYPGWGPNSILHIKGIWSDYKFLVMDEEFTLSEIDRRYFRKEFDDPRIFFAMSKGSLSSPPLRNEPYYGYKLNEQLNDQVKRFLSSPFGLQIETEKQTVYLSSLFQSSSYGREFISKFAIDKKFKGHEPATRAVLNFITNYVSKDIAAFLEVGNYSVKYMKYDWTINDGP
jgi:hypothetical protein